MGSFMGETAEFGERQANKRLATVFANEVNFFMKKILSFFLVELFIDGTSLWAFMPCCGEGAHPFALSP